MNKVYVLTLAKFFENGKIIGVYSTYKKAEKALRSEDSYAIEDSHGSYTLRSRDIGFDLAFIDEWEVN